MGVSTSSAGTCPGRRTFTSCAALAHGWSTHGRPGNGTRRYRSPPPGPASNTSSSSRYAESQDHAGVGGGDRAGRGGPPPRGWGAAPPFPRRVVLEQRAQEGISWPIDRTAAPNPPDESMPTAPSSPRAQTWLAGCIRHQDLPAGAPEAVIEINGRPFKALLDSGSDVSLVQAQILPPRSETKSLLPITCVHGDTRQVPARRVTISASPGSWPVEVGIMKDLPMPVLLGRDWPGFEALLTAATQPASPRGGRRGRRAARKPRRRPVLLASDSGRDGESPSQNPNVFYDVFQQVT